MAVTAAVSGSGVPFAHAFRALRHRDFRLFFIGQGISRIGAWMQQVAMSWLVYRLTGSAFALGVIGFASQFPTFLLAPIAGVVADRHRRHRIVVVTQALSLIEATILSVLVLTGAVQVWHIIVLSAALGIINAFDIPARQSLFSQLVHGPEDLANAIALNSSMFNMARLIGPAIAGLLIGVVGEGPVFVLDAVSYLAVLIALFRMDAANGERPERGRPALSHLREGFRYAFGFPPIRAILTLLALTSLLGMPYVVLLPVFASDVLGGGPQTLGFLMSAAGLGALGGALYLASRPSVRGLSRVIVIAVTVFGVGLIAFSVSRSQPLSIALLLVTGFGMMVQSASSNTVLQTIVDEDKRGRIMSLYTMAFMGMAPFGSLLAGTLASNIGAPATVMIGGIACLGAAAWFYSRLPAIRALVRPIYVRLGIIPEVATGLQTATELRPKA
ncbi:MAG TPA: MFS transporter [Longimicrobiales bacterium]